MTHFHYDHVGAADALREATGARVACDPAPAPRPGAGPQCHVRVESTGHP
ncbi:MBL fold metallo-hydrolase [Streptomyces sp. NPDC101776]